MNITITFAEISPMAIAVAVLIMCILLSIGPFVLGTVFLQLEINEIWKGFPVDLFVALVGLTYLFGFAQNNGAIEVLVTWCMRLVRGNVALAPWIFFAITVSYSKYLTFFGSKRVRADAITPSPGQ